MASLVDFYQYKYSRKNYYLNLIFTREKIENIKRAIDNGFEDLFINKEYQYAYKKLQILFNEALDREKNGYINLKINKCYLKYLKNLYFSYYNAPESKDIKDLILYMQYLTEEENENLSKFTTLNEDIKINILSYI